MIPPRPSTNSAIDSRRCFVALPLPEDVNEWLARQQSTLRRDLDHSALRWVPPQQMHLTLLFLGDVAVEHLASLSAALQIAASTRPRFEMNAGGLGCFPDARRPKVLWSGLHGEIDALQQLQRQVADKLNPFAQKPDNKPFHPHLTLARVKFEDKILASQMARVVAASNAAPQKSMTWSVSEVLLMSSELRREGAVHSVLQRVSLAT